jgi:hypothetical protein
MRKKKVEDDEYKDPLEVDIICTLSTESVKKIFLKFLPVLVTGVATTMKWNETKYLVATKHGHIKGSFSRGQLHYREQFTAEMLQINTEVEGFKKALLVRSLYRASSWIYM